MASGAASMNEQPKGTRKRFSPHTTEVKTSSEDFQWGDHQQSCLLHPLRVGYGLPNSRPLCVLLLFGAYAYWRLDPGTTELRLC